MVGKVCEKCFFFFKQKTAYEIYQCDWSSDVCSSDLDSTPPPLTWNTAATYVHGPYIDEVVQMQRGGADYYYHRDDQYNVMAVTTDRKSVV